MGWAGCGSSTGVGAQTQLSSQSGFWNIKECQESSSRNRLIPQGFELIPPVPSSEFTMCPELALSFFFVPKKEFKLQLTRNPELGTGQRVNLMDPGVH